MELAEKNNWRGKLAAWQRTGFNAKTAKTSMRGGPQWDKVIARLTMDVHAGTVLRCESDRSIIRNVEHALLVGGPRDIRTMTYTDC